MTDSNSITYVSNAGVLIKINDKKILIDGLCKSEEPIYKSTPEIIKEQVIEGIEPFNDIDLMLITHQHSDHFDVNSVVQFLKRNPNTFIISTHEVISRIGSYASDIEIRNLIVLEPKSQRRQKVRVSGIDILAISMVHDGKEYANISNLAYLIDYGIKVLHLGDAAPTIENFETLNLHQYMIDLLVANFPYVGLPIARKIVKEYIKPKKIAVVHLPYKEIDSFGWISATKKSYDRAKDDFIPAEFLEEIGLSISI